MKSFTFITVLLALGLITAACAAAAATFKPFVRSRYSRRWQRLYATTDSATTVALLNRTDTTQEALSRGPLHTLEAEVTTTLANSAVLLNVTVTPAGESTPTPTPLLTTNSEKQETTVGTYKALTTSTEHPRQNVSSMPTDYDYYGNGGDVDDDGNHKYD